MTKDENPEPELVPPTPLIPTTGKWVWKEDSKTLEFMSIYSDRSRHRKTTRQMSALRDTGFKGRHTPSAGTRQKGRGAGGKAQDKLSKAGKQKKEEEEEEELLVTLADVKEVSISMLSKIVEIPPHFDLVFKSEQLDDLLYSLLRYFRWVFEKRAQDNKPNPMNIEPSRKEREAYDRILQRMQASEKFVGKTYSGLVLGLGLPEGHHMHCGMSRVSNTRSDRAVYETVYSFCVYVVWIAFKRKDYHLVEKDLGRLLRSDTFNPAIRIKNFNPQQHDKEEKISPAAYRRLHQKRPAIKSVLAQRSPAIISILPSPKEESEWLFKKRGDIRIKSGKEKDSPEEEENEDEDVEKLGILGDPMSMYTGQLAPRGTEQDEEEGEEEEDGDKQDDGAEKEGEDDTENLPEEPHVEE